MPIMILPCGREDNVLSLYDYISVLYAPYVGALGLDMARKTTREDLFAQQPVKSCLGINHLIDIVSAMVYELTRMGGAAVKRTALRKL